MSNNKVSTSEKSTVAEASLLEVIAQARAVITQKLAEHALQVSSLPDNPQVSRREGKSFVISSSALGTTSWDPFYHDWKSQYEQIGFYLINAMTDTKSRTALASIVETGKERLQSTTRTYHPDVVRQVYPHVMDVVTALRHWFKPGNEPEVTFNA